MKLDLHTLTLATMALGVTALPAADNNKAGDLSAHKVRGAVGGLVVPRDHDECTSSQAHPCILSLRHAMRSSQQGALEC